jgi:hypothetical protein
MDVPGRAFGKTLAPGADLGHLQPLEPLTAESGGGVVQAVDERVDRVLLGDVLREVLVDEPLDRQVAMLRHAGADSLQVAVRGCASLTLRPEPADLAPLAVLVAGEPVGPRTAGQLEHRAGLDARHVLLLFE